ncbi:LacI family transcriptional regulator [Agrobacterium sp. a22-2]|uniref:LacI family DNA-binding transcriptional regulator n=1 Tax=Agrobacterium sp. a22-2 TaxID=2283840 RepID=UPI00144647D1|nr:LacI family DNA-binding transcriptional regulator [Agrobacterium sp. a22-2]NKN37446.1 LacI family transcriptional regulator [Agrobacterium sp. a22-2]
MSRLPRIVDVARRAGVSPSTVSRALSNPEKVAPETLEIVAHAVEAVGYTINVAARNLRQQRTQAVFVLVPDLSSPLFSEILAGVASVLTAAGYSMFVGDQSAHNSPGGKIDLLSYMNRSRCDGVIVLGGDNIAVRLLDRADVVNVPLVCAFDWPQSLPFPHISTDNAQGGRLAVDHLHDLGHRKIGHIRGNAANFAARRREEGMRQRMRELELPIREDWFLNGDFRFDAGVGAAAVWLAMPASDRPTAVFCCSDEIAIGFIGSLQRAKIEVPKDVSIIGFDGIKFGAHLSVPLTTVAIPLLDVGVFSAETLVKAIRTAAARPPAVEQPSRLILPVQLVERDSVRVLPVVETEPDRKNDA